MKPIRSRDDLTRCVSCRRHVRAAARPSLTGCPFCGANLLSDSRVWSRAGRSGLLAGALLAFTACREEGPPPPPPVPAPEVEATEPDPVEDAFEAEPADRPRPSPRYGQPPSQRPPDLDPFGDEGSRGPGSQETLDPFSE